jgi:hypothetical protein
MGFHIHTLAAKMHTFGFQSQPLFDGRIILQFDRAACAQHPLPWQAK